MGVAVSAKDKAWFAAVASLESCVLCERYGVQVAHRNEGRGMGQKSPSHMTAALCPDCHHAIDNGRDLEQATRRLMMANAIVLTHDALIRAGKLRLA